MTAAGLAAILSLARTLGVLLVLSCFLHSFYLLIRLLVLCEVRLVLSRRKTVNFYLERGVREVHLSYKEADNDETSILPSPEENPSRHSDIEFREAKPR